jgi:hypothetical protein
MFDRARLALAPYLDRELFAAELAHALTHVTAAQLRAALEGGGWPPPWQTESEPRRNRDEQGSNDQRKL